MNFYQKQIRNIRYLLLVFVVLIATTVVFREAQAKPDVETAPVGGTDLLLTGVVDATLPGGLPKAIEVYVINDIPDLSIYGLGSANNGGGSDGEEFTFPADTATAGDFIYVASESTEFNNFFGFTPNYTNSVANINGDDAIELFGNSTVIDVFGDINTDGTGQPWEYTNGWAYRNDATGPDGSTFVLGNWTFSGVNALNGETSNDTAATPFPLGSYSPGIVDDPPIIISTNPADGAVSISTATTITLNFSEDVDLTANAVTIECPVSTPITFSGLPANVTSSVELTPDAPLPEATTCEVTVVATEITDQTGNELDEGTNYVFTFTTFDSSTPPTVLLNEIYVNPPGGDDEKEYVEIINSSGGATSLATGWLLQIEGDSTNQGVVDQAQDLSALSTGTNGLILLGENYSVSTPWDGLGLIDPNTVLADLSDTSVENGSITFMLVANFSGSEGDDLDTNNDGILDVTPWSEILDSVGWSDGGGSDYVYSPASLVQSAGTPDAGTRFLANVDAESFDAWYNADLIGEAQTVVYDAAKASANLPDGGRITPGDANELFTPIYDIQGDGLYSPLEGQVVTTIGVVTGDFQDTAAPDNQIGGFHIQDLNGDGNTATSDGVYVLNDTTPMMPGDIAIVTGTVDENYSLTVIENNPVVASLGSGNDLPEATLVQMPVTDVDDFEPFEGMLVSLQDAAGDLTVTEIYWLGRYGETRLAAGGRIPIFTQNNAPDVTGYDAHLEAFANSSLIVDDGRTGNNNFPVFYARGGNELTPDNTLRGGDTISSVLGVMDYNFGQYKIQPTEPVGYTATNIRPDTPPVTTGDVIVVSFNVENFFNGDGNGGDFPTPRGAETFTDFVRQRIKIYEALAATDADIVGLQELENDGFGSSSAVAELAKIMNEGPCWNSAPECLALGYSDPGLGADTYTYVDAGTSEVGDDAIAVGFIYKINSIKEVGSASILTEPAELFLGPSTNRAPMAQTFEVIEFNGSMGGRLTLAVTHMKSKGPSQLDDNGTECDVDILPGDPLYPQCDQGDGQGYWNPMRTAGAEAVADWLATNPTGIIDPDHLIVGDINAYKMEDPITSLGADGYISPIPDDYSYVFDGQWGSLDYILGNAAANGQYVDGGKWHINSDEPDALGYSTEYNDPSLYAPDKFRNSDHDPILASFDLNQIDYSSLPDYALAWHTYDGAFLGDEWQVDDGVTRLVSVWKPDEEVGLRVDVKSEAFSNKLVCWIDWGNDNVFDLIDDKVVDASVDWGVHDFYFFVPSDAEVGNGTAATLNTRCRLYPINEPTHSPEVGTEVPDGGAVGGEVEDFAFAFTPTAISLDAFGVNQPVNMIWIMLLVAAFGLILSVIVVRRNGRRLQ